MKRGIPQFAEDPNRPGNLVAMNDEAHEVIARTTRTRQEVIAGTGVSESEEINEEAGLGPGWVNVPIATPQQTSMKKSYLAIGMSEAEANIAAGIEDGPHDEGSKLRRVILSQS